jgi:uncharacterized membrane protein YfcA
MAAAALTYVYPEPTEMVRTLLVCSITIQLYCSARVLRAVEWHELAPYVVGGIAAAPVGLVILVHVSANTYAVIIGTLLVAYAACASIRPFHFRALRRPALDACVGALGGVTSGLAASPGMFPVMWCSARGLPKERQRAICQPYMLVVQIVTLAWLQRFRPGEGQALMSLWPFIPVALVGAYFGYSIFQRISTERFRTVVLVLLAVSGALLILKAA